MGVELDQAAGAYRIVIVGVHEDGAPMYVARAPELPECAARAATRGEALERLEEEIEARLINMSEQGIDPPRPVALQPLDGQLSLKVTPAVHQDLLFAAKEASVELDDLLREVLVRAASAGPARPPSRGGSFRRDASGRHRHGGVDGQRYQGIMQNSAEFMEYARRLERDGAGGGGRRGRRG